MFNSPGTLTYLSFHDNSISTDYTWARWYTPGNNSNNGVNGTQRTLPDSEDFTVCYWAKLTFIKKFNALLKYASEQDIWIVHGRDTVTLYISESAYEFYMKTPFLTWTAYCIVVSSENKRISLYINGTLQGSKTITHSGLSVQGNGELSLGLIDDEGDSFHGDVANLQVWMSALSPQEVNQTINCMTTGSAPEVILNASEWTLNGLAEWVTSEAFNSICELMQYNNSNLIFFPNIPKHIGASLCHSLQGKLPVPFDEIAVKILRQGLLDYFRANDNNTMVPVLLGISRTSNHRWINDYNNDTVRIPLNVSKASIYDIQDVYLAYDGKTDQFKLIESSSPYVIACLTPVALHTLRGLCEKSDLEKRLWLHQTHNGNVLFRGIHGTTLTVEDRKWLLRGARRGRHRAVLEPPLMLTPMGSNEWIFTDIYCQANMTPIILKLTRCYDNYFTCGNLDCISTENVCDGKSDCDDGSDEISCSTKIILPDGYQQESPFSKTEETLFVTCGIRVINFQSVDLSLLKAEVYLEVNLQWKDSRLMYKHLAARPIENAIPNTIVNQIWTPSLFMVSSVGAAAEVESREKILYLEVNGTPLEDDISSAQEVVKHSSESVIQHLIARVRVVFDFDPHLHFYPFDTQTCRLFITYAGSSRVILLPGSLSTMKPPFRSQLLEYEIKNMSLISVRNELIPGPGVEFITTLKHTSSYYILSIYMPTFLLVLISCTTLFFDHNKFSDRIIVALTSFLVLATFLSTTTSSMARVAYFTLIDIWLAFCNTVVFVICMGHSCLHVLLRIAKNEPTCVKVGSVGKPNMGLDENLTRAMTNETYKLFERVDKIFKITVPLGTITFLAVYCLGGFNSMMIYTY
ncbi:hypothetical protein SK128_016478 [Halocaridina rubra]|uniref:Pentraxin (PTX) domain-containing protein n=1 Tax=Halocaridina rubra TaxID=373956 RepID=A0AAN8WWH6_HALRR